MVIEVIGLHKYFGKHHILKNISFSLNKGEIVGFIGPNGSGKSTTMKCMVSLIFPEEGEIIIDGFSLSEERNKAICKIAALIESPGLYPNLSGIDNLSLFATLKNVNKNRVKEIIEIIQLGDGINKKVKEYSMGMKQRLALGIVLLSKPEYIILDEPFNGLDPQGVFDLRTVLVDLAKEGHGIMISSHQLLELEKISKRNIFIKKGEIVEEKDLKQEDSISTYKVSFTNGNFPNKNLINELLDRNYIVNCEIIDYFYLFQLPQGTRFSNLLIRLLDEGLEIDSIIPVEGNIESIYRDIYLKGD